ncbi:mechanosensitive ion channel protein [Haematobacter massiliensis]|uniref:Small-conductance mechanosensitive channel n=1 Tax=Haematobacter genomosp. 1 TaxID=366618 RepID=A0A212ADK5_9RHOB|nr:MULTISPECIES: mechanosensitive ion channel domain-containing protein [Haematobacter]OWJ69322.1 mechanosensitive ion channel protein [Haematobacter massiliensis]OWJ79192.1 mechanosensitive ion channel protein [Haematobacter genomosp. 1]OWJ83829.1 mechanosensitive ion channel protein [Haematobacter massiliensis]
MIWPDIPKHQIGALLALLLFALFGEALPAMVEGGAAWWEPLRNTALSGVLFLGAHLLHAISSARLTRRRKGRRPVPKVALDLLRLALFAAATLASLSLFFRQDLSGILTGSGLLLAVLGFAIRNVVADTFSGLALGLEAPFRIGDWVAIDGLAQGRVQEIGWRSTRLITRDSTHVILPNSQISRQRITNYSAPRPEYRDHAELTLPATLPVAEARILITEALVGAETIATGKSPEVQVAMFAPQGITYRVKYWVPQHDREMACRNEVLSRIDAALREKGISLKPLVEGTA